MRKAVASGARRCSFFDELVRVAEGWVGNVNETQAYVFREHLLVVLKIKSHQPEGEDVPCRMAVVANEAADELAGAGARKGSVDDIYVPGAGANTTIMIGDRGSRRYVSRSLRDLGFEQARSQLLELGQQGAAAQLHSRIGGAYGYYNFTGGVWSLESVGQFMKRMCGDTKSGEGWKRQGMVKSGISGAVRVYAHHGWVARMMRALSDCEDTREEYIEGGDQVSGVVGCSRGVRHEQWTVV